MSSSHRNQLLHAALEYARLGWHIFPVHGVRDGHCTCGAWDCASAGKHPHVKGWLRPRDHRSRHDRSVVAAMASTQNIGAACGPSGLLVLDIDPRHGGDESLERLEGRHRHFYGLKVRTGGGGWHLFFRKPDGAMVKSRSNALGDGYPGIDVRADGGYVVLPPSLHASGKQYEWEAGGQ